MSCMIMNHEALAALANAVEYRLVFSYDYWGFEASRNLRPVLLNGTTSGRLFLGKDIYSRLYLLNVQAYKGRYKKYEEPALEEVPDIDSSAYAIHHRVEYKKYHYVVQPWHYHLAKLLDFWLYQTNEDITRNDPLRLAMQEFRDDLYNFIVMNSLQYNDVQWGNLPSCDIGDVPKRMGACGWLECRIRTLWTVTLESVSKFLRRVVKTHGE